MSDGSEGEVAPWAMQLVAHVEKVDPPGHSAVCEAAAMACVTLLADERSLPGGPWQPFVQQWWDGRIRKHARRARGAEWRRAQEPEGVTVTHAGAEVRAYVPCPTDAVPTELRKLQLQGFELADPARRSSVEPDGLCVVISITPDPPLPTGKAAAAAAHAAQLAWVSMGPERRAAWCRAGVPLVVEHPPVERWRELLTAAPVVVQDGGFTVVAPGTVTALARWA
jgi:peptidyl-tRNA hydrolase